ncbi:hypothetical protein S83_009455 [Arachis hypogaea]
MLKFKRVSCTVAKSTTRIVYAIPLQSSVCLKQHAFDLLELLLLQVFPELDDVFKKVHEEKHRFGEFISPK